MTSRASLLGVHNRATPEVLDALAEFFQRLADETRTAAARQRYKAAEDERFGRANNQRARAIANGVELIELEIGALPYAEALADLSALRVAVNQEYAMPGDPVGPSDEVALFPPVTGG